MKVNVWLIPKAKEQADSYVIHFWSSSLDYWVFSHVSLGSKPGTHYSKVEAIFFVPGLPVFSSKTRVQCSRKDKLYLQSKQDTKVKKEQIIKTYSNIQMKKVETWINFCVQKREVPNYILEGMVEN